MTRTDARTTTSKSKYARTEAEPLTLAPRPRFEQVDLGSGNLVYRRVEQVVAGSHSSRSAASSCTDGAPTVQDEDAV